MKNIVIESSTNKIIFKNFTFLTVLQLLNYIFPVLTIPYVVRVIGLDNFGEISLALAYAGYLAVLLEFGFNYTAARELAIGKNKFSEINLLFNAVYLFRLFLLLLVCVVIYSIKLLIPSLIKGELLAFLLLSSIGNALSPYWFFKGIERINVFTIINFISKLIITLSIFIFINEKSDYKYLYHIFSFNLLFVGIVGSIYIITEYRLRFAIPALISVKKTILDAFYVFWSLFFGSIFNYTNAIILGYFYNTEVVGLFSAAEKIILNIKIIFSNIYESSYSRIAIIISKNKKLGVKILTRYIIYFGVFALLTTFLIMIFSDKLILIFFGSSFNDSIVILRFLAPIIFLYSINSVLGNLTIYNFEYYKLHAIAMFFTMIIYLFSLLFTVKYSAIGISISIIISELFLALGFVIIIRSKKLLNGL